MTMIKQDGHFQNFMTMMMMIMTTMTMMMIMMMMMMMMMILSGEGGHARSRPLRKTHSWAPLSSPPSTQGSEFSLFSPGSSIDLLSGIRQNLSRLDLSSEG